MGDRWSKVQAWGEQNREHNNANMRRAWGDAKNDLGTIRGEVGDLRAEAAARTVTRHGIGGGAHSVHAVLTVCTCGVWAPVWIVHTLMRRGKSVTTPPA